MKVDFTISYNATDQRNETVRNETVIPLNGDEKTRDVTGICNYTSGKAFFQIKWNEYGIVAGPHHTFRMDFNLDLKTKKWTVPKVTAVFMTNDTSEFKHAEEHIIRATADGTKRFGSRKSGTNYICNDGIKVTMSNGVTAAFEDLVLQPFSTKSKLEDEGDHCPADKKDDDDDDNTVPIAVGAALGGLVLVVLIAYIVGRRRSNRGYEQV